MHTIEPYYNWRDVYASEEDEGSPFYAREYSEFEFHNTIYNYYIHPQWDEFGSPTLYTKILFADYGKQFAVLEMIGEWNDGIHNDIMFLKQEVIDHMPGINKFAIIGENVLNFHGSDDCYYEEWKEEILETGGWVAFLNFRPHVAVEMSNYNIHHHCQFLDAAPFNNWRTYQPDGLFQLLSAVQQKVLSY